MSRIESPLRRDRSGFCFRFKLIGDAKLYGQDAACACIAGLQRMTFTGRCEYYEADDLVTGDWLVGLALKQTEGPELPDYEWGKEFMEAVAEASPPSIKVDLRQSERCGINGIRSQLLESGVAEFKAGVPIRVLSEIDEDLSWFEREVLHESERVN